MSQTTKSFPGRHSFFVKRTSASASASASKIPPPPVAAPSHPASETSMQQVGEEQHHDHRPHHLLADNEEELEDDLANLLANKNTGGYSAASSAAASPRSLAASPNTFDTPSRNHLLTSVLHSLEAYELSDHEQPAASTISSNTPSRSRSKTGPLPPYHYHYHNNAGSDSDSDIPPAPISSSATLPPLPASSFLLPSRGGILGRPGLPRPPAGGVGRTAGKSSSSTTGGAVKSAGSFGFIGVNTIGSGSGGMAGERGQGRGKGSGNMNNNSHLSDSDDGMEKEERRLGDQVSTLKRQLSRNVPTLPWSGNNSPTNIPTPANMKDGAHLQLHPMLQNPAAFPVHLSSSAATTHDSSEVFYDDFKPSAAAAVDKSKGKCGGKQELQVPAEAAAGGAAVGAAGAGSKGRGKGTGKKKELQQDKSLAGATVASFTAASTTTSITTTGAHGDVANATEFAVDLFKRRSLLIACMLGVLLFLGGLGGFFIARSTLLSSQALNVGGMGGAEGGALPLTQQQMETLLEKEKLKWQQQQEQLQQYEQQRQQRANQEREVQAKEEAEMDKDEMVDLSGFGSSRSSSSKIMENVDASTAVVRHPGACSCDGIPLFKILLGRIARTFGRLVRFLDRHGKNRGRVRHG